MLGCEWGWEGGSGEDGGDRDGWGDGDPGRDRDGGGDGNRRGGRRRTTVGADEESLGDGYVRDSHLGCGGRDECGAFGAGGVGGCVRGWSVPWTLREGSFTLGGGMGRGGEVGLERGEVATCEDTAFTYNRSRR